MDKQFWWCGWEVPDDMPDDATVKVWPRTMRGLNTGRGFSFTTHTGLVWAASAEDALATVASCYTTHGHLIKQRWPPIPRGQLMEVSERFVVTEATLRAMMEAGDA